MDQGAHVIGLELIVDDLDRAIEMFVAVFGFEVVERGPASMIAGELAIVTDGSLGITLVRPSVAAERDVLRDRTPRLSQLVLGAAEPEAVRRDVLDAGLATQTMPAGFFVTPESVAGALGQQIAVVVTGHAES